MLLSLCLPVILALLVPGGYCGTYLITAPSTLQPGYPYAVNVDILNGSHVTVEATLQDWRYNGTIRDYVVTSVDTASGNYSAGSSGNLNLFSDNSYRFSDCRLYIRGRGDLQFERTEHLSVSDNVVVLLVQTDKAIYKPGQLVRFRVIAVNPSLQVYQGPLTINIKDPNNNRIKVMPSQAPDAYGVIEGSLELSEQPMFGEWSIQVQSENTPDTHTQPFTVANYELPRFEVTVELNPFALRSESTLNGKVVAKYTFGEDVKGLVELHVGPDYGPDSCGNQRPTTQISFDIDGTATFQIPRGDINKVVGIYDETRVKVTAFVIEASSGVRLNGSSVITYYERDSKIKFLENTPGVFKPGLPYTAFIQATTPDGKSPPVGGNQLLSVYTVVNYELTVPDQTFYSKHRFEGSFPLPGQNITLPASGVVPVNIAIPDNATSIEIKATFRGVQQTKSVGKSWSQSNNFLRLTVLDSNIQAGQSVSVEVEGTEPLGNVYYKVFVQGRELHAETVNGNGQRSFTFEISELEYLAPLAQLVAYYFRGEDEVVADSVAYQVAEYFENEVSVSLSRNQSEPNQGVDVLLTASPDSRVYVLAVDQSVLLLKSGNDITESKVTEALSNFDRSSDKPSSPDYALSYSSSYVKDVFEKIGLLVISDVEMQEQRLYAYDYRNYRRGPAAMGMDMDMEMSMVSDDMGPMSMRKSGGRGAQAKVERIRSVFPEAWLWEHTAVGANGTASLPTTVPDTITSWVVSAFATNTDSGLGVAPTTTKLKVFRPFFISLSYPSTVTRGEHVVVQATIFNYLQSDLQVTVRLSENDNFQNIQIDANGEESFTSGQTERIINVASDEQGVAYFPIKATEIGLLELEVTAQSTLAADGVRRFISVEAEGAPVKYNTPVFINIDNNATFTDTIAFTLPPSTVDGSQKAKVKVTGDLIGSSLDGLSSLLELPTGCGEQSMVKFAPDYYIAKYLTASGQMTDSVETQIKHYLATGYQRQLTYQRYDKSFSAFGNNDPSGSTWLTAMVAGIFAEASSLTFIDSNVITGAVNWLVDRQFNDGSFSSVGKVLDPNTQRARTAEGLTAYILTTLLRTSGFSGNQWQTHRWSNATQKARLFLEQRISANAVTDQLSLAMVSYALSLAGSEQASTALNQLDSLSTTDGALTYWEESSTTGVSSASSYLAWHPPIIQSRPVNILTTSYAILALTAAGRVQEAFPSVRWLVAQRNPNGGFASSQDTTVALQALAAYATASSSPDSDLSVSVSGNMEAGEAEFSVTHANAWTLQIQELNALPTQTAVQATGIGFALVEMVYSFNVNDELSTSSFDVSTVLLDDDIDSFNLMICTKWLWDRDTGMVVQEISIPSGFNPDLTSLGTVVGLQRSERRGNTIAVYFDKISKSSLCYSLMMTRTAKVARSQQSFVRTYDYYQPSDQSTVFYHPRKLQESTVCDVCDECCP